MVPSVSNASLHWDGSTWSLELLALRYIVEVLDGDDLRDSLRLRELLGSDVAQTDVTTQPLTFQFDERGKWFLDGSVRRLGESTNPEVDDIQPLDTKIPEIVMSGVD